jgi:hypothetical protein
VSFSVDSFIPALVELLQMDFSPDTMREWLCAKHAGRACPRPALPVKGRGGLNHSVCPLWAQ